MIEQPTNPAEQVFATASDRRVTLRPDSIEIARMFHFIWETETYIPRSQIIEIAQKLGKLYIHTKNETVMLRVGLRDRELYNALHIWLCGELDDTRPFAYNVPYPMLQDDCDSLRQNGSDDFRWDISGFYQGNRVRPSGGDPPQTAQHLYCLTSETGDDDLAGDMYAGTLLEAVQKFLPNLPIPIRPGIQFKMGADTITVLVACGGTDHYGLRLEHPQGTELDIIISPADIPVSGVKEHLDIMAKHPISS